MAIHGTLGSLTGSARHSNSDLRVDGIGYTNAKGLMVTGSVMISGSLSLDGIAGDLTIGPDSDGTDRKIVFGHSTLKSSIGIDDSQDVFAINTNAILDNTNDLEINSVGDVTLHNGNLYVRGASVHGASGGALKLRADTNVLVYIDDDGNGSNEFRVLDGGGNIKFKVDESGNTQMDGDLTVSGGNITEDGSTVAIAISSTENVQIANGRLSGPTDATFNIDSDGDMEFQIDRDSNGTNYFRFKNGSGVEVTQIDESGNIQLDGDLTVSGGDIKDTAGSTMLSFDGSGNIDDIATITQDVVIGGGIPSLTLGDGGNEDIKFLINGDTNDYHIGYDATDDVLKIGTDSSIGFANKTALHITSGSFVGAPVGSKWGTAVHVAGGAANTDSHWVKVAKCPAWGGNYAAHSAIFLVSLQPYATSLYESDDYFIVRVRYSRNTSSGPDADMTDVVVEQFNSGHYSDQHIQADHFVLTHDGTSGNGAELWVQAGSSEHTYTQVFCSVLHSHTTKNHYNVQNDHNVAGWEIQSGQSWQASMDSMGTDVTGVRPKKHFKELMVEGSLLCSGTIKATYNDITVGDGSSADPALFIDGVTTKYHIGSDATDDTLKIGTGDILGNNKALLVTSGSYVGMSQGNKWADTVTVATGQPSAVNSDYVKIAAAPAFSGNYTVYSAVFMISLQPYSTSGMDHDSNFIVRVRYSRNAAGGIDADTTDVIVESLNAGQRSDVDIQADHFILTHAGASGAELWVQNGAAEHNYAQVFCSILHGVHTTSHSSAGENTGGWEIQSGMDWQDSLDSMGSEIYGIRPKKHFKEVMVEDSLLCSGTISAAGNTYSGGDIIGTDATHTLITNNGGGYIDLKSNSATYGVIIRDYDSADWGMVTANTGYLGLSYNATTCPVRIYSEAGGTHRVLHYNNGGFTYATEFQNDGNSTARRGIAIQCGRDDASSTNYAISIQDGDGNAIGYCSFSGSTVTWGAFTGVHPATVTESDAPVAITHEEDDTQPGTGATVEVKHWYERGTLVEVLRTSYQNGVGNSNIIYNVTKSSSAKNPSSLGGYLAPHAMTGLRGTSDIACVGDGELLVCSEGGNLAIGDYICSSNTPGHGMKQDDDLLHNYTVAKSLEVVDWVTLGVTEKLVRVSFHSG